MNLKFIFTSFLIFIAVNLTAQTVFILNETTREPVSDVAIFNAPKNLATLSDSAGKANISIFKENDSIFFQHPSFNPRVFVKKELHNNQRIYLSKKVILIDEFVISATKSRENKKDVPFMVDVLDPSLLSQTTAQSGADILLSTGNLLVQKSQGGGGSPIIRGFEANKILLVLDGVRLNNAIYRSGHLQNSITLDPAIMDRIEVVYGPTSLIYGSDALGGVVHYYTKDPMLSKEEGKPLFRANATAGYSTANNGQVYHLDFNNGFKKLGFLSSVSYKDLGNIKMGENKNPFYGDYGELHYYADRINGKDTTLSNSDPYLQRKTGYSQLDLLEKVRFSPDKYHDFILNLQYSTSSDINRYDQLKTYTGENMKYAEWYYGPQNRFFSSFKSVIKKDNRFFTNMTTTLAYQRIDEDRITRRFGKEMKMHQEEDVSVYTLDVDFLRVMKEKNRLNYGVEVTYNDVASDAFYRNINSGMTEEAMTRYPDGGSRAFTSSAYTSYKWLPNKKFIFSAGARYHYGLYKSRFNEGGVLPYEEISVANGALTGSLSMVWHPWEKWQINAIASSGFRNPNVDDYGKVRPKDGLVTVPNPNLEPEYSYNAELGITKTIEGYIKLNLTGYYTYLTNAMVRSDYTLNGADSMVYDGEMYKIISNTNSNRAYIRGLSMSLLSDLNSDLSFRSTLNITEGRDVTDDQPLSHIPPIFGRTSVKYSKKHFFTEIFVDYNGWKHMEDLNIYGEDNADEATQYGFPGWYTVNFRTSYNIHEKVQLQLAVENIFDSFYKPFASAVAGPGRNFIFTLRMGI